MAEKTSSIQNNNKALNLRVQYIGPKSQVFQAPCPVSTQSLAVIYKIQQRKISKGEFEKN